MIARETAWRVFSSELNTSTLELKGEDEKAPSYLVTRLGTKVNRILIAGVLTEKENVGNDDEPLWKGRIQDVSGNYFINVGRYQPEAAAAIADLEVPSFVAVVGKVRTYVTDDKRVFVTVRPETIVNITEETRNEWILEAAQSMWSRLNGMKKALNTPDASEKDLEKMGFTAHEANGIITALDEYGFPDSTTYLKSIQNALRILLPEKNIDFGLPEDVTLDEPEEIEIDEGGQTSGDKEDIILSLLDELDTNGLGAPREELLRRAEDEGITEDELEEISNVLMDKGLVYEPNLKHLKRI